MSTYATDSDIHFWGEDGVWPIVLAVSVYCYVFGGGYVYHAKRFYRKMSVLIRMESPRINSCLLTVWKVIGPVCRAVLRFSFSWIMTSYEKYEALPMHIKGRKPSMEYRGTEISNKIKRISRKSSVPRQASKSSSVYAKDDLSYPITPQTTVSVTSSKPLDYQRQGFRPIPEQSNFSRILPTTWTYRDMEQAVRTPAKAIAQKLAAFLPSRNDPKPEKTRPKRIVKQHLDMNGEEVAPTPFPAMKKFNKSKTQAAKCPSSDAEQGKFAVQPAPVPIPFREDREMTKEETENISRQMEVMKNDNTTTEQKNDESENWNQQHQHMLLVMQQQQQQIQQQHEQLQQQEIQKQQQLQQQQAHLQQMAQQAATQAAQAQAQAQAQVEAQATAQAQAQQQRVALEQQQMQQQQQQQQQQMQQQQQQQQQQEQLQQQQMQQQQQQQLMQQQQQQQFMQQQQTQQQQPQQNQWSNPYGTQEKENRLANQFAFESKPAAATGFGFGAQNRSSSLGNKQNIANNRFPNSRQAAWDDMAVKSNSSNPFGRSSTSGYGLNGQQAGFGKSQQSNTWEDQQVRTNSGSNGSNMFGGYSAKPTNAYSSTFPKREPARAPWESSAATRSSTFPEYNRQSTPQTETKSFSSFGGGFGGGRKSDSFIGSSAASTNPFGPQRATTANASTRRPNNSAHSPFRFGKNFSLKDIDGDSTATTNTRRPFASFRERRDAVKTNGAEQRRNASSQAFKAFIDLRRKKTMQDIKVNNNVGMDSVVVEKKQSVAMTFDMTSPDIGTGRPSVPPNQRGWNSDDVSLSPDIYVPQHQRETSVDAEKFLGITRRGTSGLKSSSQMISDFSRLSDQVMNSNNRGGLTNRQNQSRYMRPPAVPSKNRNPFDSALNPSPMTRTPVSRSIYTDPIGSLSPVVGRRVSPLRIPMSPSTPESYNIQQQPGTTKRLTTQNVFSRGLDFN